MVKKCSSRLSQVSSCGPEFQSPVHLLTSFSQLIDAIEAGHIVRKINTAPKNAWDKNLNHEIMLEAAKKVGIA